MPTTTPDALARQYRNLSVTLNDGRCIYGLDVHNYRIFQNGSCTASMNVRQQLENAVAAVCPSVGFQRYKWTHSVGGWDSDFPPLMPGTTEIVPMWTTIGIPNAGRPFLGKGFIEDIQLALRLAVDFGFAQPTLASLQAFVDTNIGLDCSGFAASFYRGQWIGTGASAYLVEANAPRILELDDIRPGDAIVFEDGEHIGLIYSVSHFSRGVPGATETGVYCSVAEATSDALRRLGILHVGLNCTDYRVRKLPNGRFEVARPINQVEWHIPPVYIVRPQA